MGISLNDLPPHIQKQVQQKETLAPKIVGTARAASPQGRTMNKWEEAYQERLKIKLRAGEIQHFSYEALKFRLAEKKCWYTPDFIVLNADNCLEVHEVKGHWEDDARVKIKVAASLFPYMIFYAITKNNGVWTYERI